MARLSHYKYTRGELELQLTHVARPDPRPPPSVHPSPATSTSIASFADGSSTTSTAMRFLAVGHVKARKPGVASLGDLASEGLALGALELVTPRVQYSVVRIARIAGGHTEVRVVVLLGAEKR